MPVEVSFRPKDFNNALKQLFALKSTRGQPKLEYVDFNTGDDEVELVTTGIASSFPGSNQNRRICSYSLRNFLGPESEPPRPFRSTGCCFDS